MSNITLIEVNKISTSYREKTTAGGAVVNPHDRESLKEGETKVQVEFIRIDKIKSFREWKKSQEQEAIEGDFTIIYFEEDSAHVQPEDDNKDKDPKKPKRKTAPVMLINENFQKFGLRLGAIPLPQIEEA